MNIKEEKQQEFDRKLYKVFRFKLFVFALFMLTLTALIVFAFLVLSSRRIVIKPLDEDGKILTQYIPEYSPEKNPRFLIDTLRFFREEKHVTQEKKLANDLGAIEAFIVDEQGNDSGLTPIIESSKTDSTKFYVIVPNGLNGIPGKLNLKVVVSRDEKKRESIQPFYWGVIALSYNQSSFMVGEPAELSISVVDDRGETVCNTDLTVTITNPASKKTVVSTNNICNNRSLTNRPHIKITYSPEDEGRHEVRVTSVRQSRTHERQSHFLVTDKAAITVTHHNSATIIFPSSDQDIKMTLATARPIDNGTIRYPVPENLDIRSISHGGKIEKDESGNRAIVWKAELKSGENMGLSFTYRAPDSHPRLYSFGLLEILKRDLPNRANLSRDDLNTIFQDKHRYEVIAN